MDMQKVTVKEHIIHMIRLIVKQKIKLKAMFSKIISLLESIQVMFYKSGFKNVCITET